MDFKQSTQIRMALKCENPSIEILQPRSGFVFAEGGSNTPPFQMKGAPVGIKNPEPLKGITKFVRKPNASTSTDPKVYFAKENYSEEKLATENILGGDMDTTLRYEGQSFQHKFTALHRSLWEGPYPEVSLFFTNDDGAMFHICIPIEYTTETKGENLYLKKWLSKDSTIPNGLTTNDLFNFRSSERIQCATLQYCLEYNQSRAKHPYILCIFKNTLQVNQNTLQDWLKQDMQLNSPTNTKRHILFDEVLCLVLRGTFSKFVLDTPDPYVISDEQFFSIKRKQDTVQPTYYTLPKNSLSGVKTKEGFRSGPLHEGFTTTRTLNNIKCYPIDLATQVDDDGNIVVDEVTNKPINPKQVTEDDIDFDADIGGGDVDQNQHTIAYWIFWVIFAILLFAFITTLVVYTLRGKSVTAAAVNAAVPTTT
jgi:hypothetical protein